MPTGKKKFDIRRRYTGISLFCALLMACSGEHDEQITAVAVVSNQSDGTTQTLKPSDRQLQRISKTTEAVDSLHPRSDPPFDAPSKSVAHVTVPGVLKLVDGTNVIMDGVRCEKQGVEYLNRVLMDKSISVIVIPSVEGSAEPVPAAVWTRDQDLGPSYSNIVETAITSGWCAVEATQTCRHNARYAALAEAFAPFWDSD